MKQTVHVPPGIHRPCLKIKTEFKKIINEKALTFGEGFFILTAKVETVGIEPTSKQGISELSTCLLHFYFSTNVGKHTNHKFA